MIDLMVPFYGRRDHLRVLVDSVLAQTSPDWRLTIVDDAYPDPTAAGWVADLDDGRIRLVRNEVNLGINANFQRCVELAAQDHVVLLGGDDVLLPSYVASVGAAAKMYGAAMTQPWVVIIDAEGVVHRNTTDSVKEFLARRLARRSPREPTTTLLGGEDLAVSLMHGNWTYFPAICWRRDALVRAGFTPGYRLILDLRLISDLLLAGESFALVDGVAFQYRRHGESASVAAAAASSRFAEEERFFAEVARDFAGHGWPRAARAARLHLTSRLHAAMLLPAAVRRRDGAARRALVTHTVGRADGPV